MQPRIGQGARFRLPFAGLMLAAALLAALLVGSAAEARNSCLGRHATIVSNAHKIVGTKAGDVIFAGGGNNVIDGRGGSDRICGGGGSDTITGVKGGGPDDGGPRNDTNPRGTRPHPPKGGGGRGRGVGGSRNEDPARGP